MFDIDHPAVGRRRMACSSDVAANADEGTAGSGAECFGDGKVSGEPFADAAGIERQATGYANP
jgi:hypothetical protein